MDVSCPMVIVSQYFTKASIGIAGYNRSSTDALSCNLNMSNDDGISQLPGGRSAECLGDLPCPCEPRVRMVLSDLDIHNVGLLTQRPQASHISLGA
jgi:hypothetical protein